MSESTSAGHVTSAACQTWLRLPSLTFILHKTDSQTQEALQLIVCDKLFVMSHNALYLHSPVLCCTQGVLHVGPICAEQSSNLWIKSNHCRLFLKVKWSHWIWEAVYQILKYEIAYLGFFEELWQIGDLGSLPVIQYCYVQFPKIMTLCQTVFQCNFIIFCFFKWLKAS